jgi:hypothetical protein
MSSVAAYVIPFVNQQIGKIMFQKTNFDEIHLLGITRIYVFYPNTLRVGNYNIIENGVSTLDPFAKAIDITTFNNLCFALNAEIYIKI